ncbi:MAG: membrane protein insertase YidC [Dolichospermum sp. JUN01]|jgi:YidC/Oxa1 family membrane protein insertase|uniref:membrane protein insertase YidC n=1 Tax=Dolichospermum circinale TaxID=109265 RepID=UPI0007FCBA10|nr:membrane protein insertase YidC [Dolichospermum circinale]MBJ7295687.1 membrane protein insertase YidC [Dolichospermum sp.]MBO1058481.1 membrane protein insertase YidC [Dolichospermum sp. JUN01]MBS9394440.1 membrane protein insertase YidC [Dolichospermum sp. OL01]MCE2698513.1 membrane protein insertase YidC [Anabaena sp. 49633_E8]MCO5798070.1 membrane protein insertase YidC [Dolichospermum sp. OL03]MDJ0503428.1 membrane protein insertase YidC [Nostocales cyanobacterium LE14-WE4]OBQ03970.1
MDFGIGFLSNNVMLPIIDLFYGFVPSYGLAIVALTLIIRFALYPLSAGSIRSMRRMKVVQPLMQKRMAEIKERYKDDQQKQQEEMLKVQNEFGNPLAGCLPLLLQMPVLLALFATLRGSPFSGVNYSVNLQIFPQEQIERIQPQAFATSPQNIYIADGEHTPISAILPGGNKLTVGEKTKIQYQTVEGKPFDLLLAEHPETKLTPDWKITKGEERVKIDAQGNIEALEPGDVTIQGTIPGLAAEKGFLFIDALGRVGAIDADNTVHWDIVGMIVFFGISLYVSQMLSGQNSSGGNPQQDTVNKITPVLFSGMFLFFPLPAGVLMYMVIGNVFQTVQTYILSREPLPEEIQKIVDLQEKEAQTIEVKALPFEPKSSKKKANG